MTSPANWKRALAKATRAKAVKNAMRKAARQDSRKHRRTTPTPGQRNDLMGRKL